MYVLTFDKSVAFLSNININLTNEGKSCYEIILSILISVADYEKLKYYYRYLCIVFSYVTYNTNLKFRLYIRTKLHISKCINIRDCE